MDIDEDEFLEMLSMYWAWNNNDECIEKTFQYLDKLGISEHQRLCWGIERGAEQ